MDHTKSEGGRWGGSAVFLGTLTARSPRADVPILSAAPSPTVTSQGLKGCAGTRQGSEHQAMGVSGGEQHLCLVTAGASNPGLFKPPVAILGLPRLGIPWRTGSPGTCSPVTGAPAPP